MSRTITNISSVLLLSMKCNYFFTIETGRCFHFEKIFVLFFIAILILFESRNIVITHKLPPPHNFWANVYCFVTIANFFVILVVHIAHYVLMRRKVCFYILNKSPRLLSRYLGFSVTSYVSVVLCIVRGVASSLNAFYYRNTVFECIYINMTMKPVLDLFNHLILTQFTTMLQMICVVNREYLEMLRFRVAQTQRHAQVINLAIALNKAYGVQILFLFIVYSLLIVSSSHYVVVGIFAFKGKMRSLVINTVLHSFSLIYAWIQVILIIRSCEMCQRNVDAFYRELFRLMRESKTLCSNKKLCLYVSMRKTVNFTACGFFNLGYPLITSIIAAATTYLVILVQFSIPKT